MDRVNLNSVYKKMLDSNIDQSNLTPCGLHNVTSITSKSSEFPPFPLSLIMKIDEPSMELRLPLLDSTVSNAHGTIHTVLDEYGILGRETFQFRYPGNVHAVNVQAADESFKKELKTKIKNSESKENNFKNGTSTSDLKRRNPFQPVVIENTRSEQVQENIKQDLIALACLDCEKTDYLIENRNMFKGLDFVTISAKELIIGRRSNGEWLICCRNKKTISDSEIKEHDKLFQMYREVQESVSKKDRRENSTCSKKKSQNIFNITSNASSQQNSDNVHDECDEMHTNIQIGDPSKHQMDITLDNVNNSTDQRQHLKPSVQHFETQQGHLTSSESNETCSVVQHDQHQFSKPTVHHFQAPASTTPTHEQSSVSVLTSFQPSLQQSSVLMETTTEHPKSLKHHSIVQQTQHTRTSTLTMQQVQNSAPHLHAVQLSPVTIATHQPQPVMLIQSSGHSFNIVPVGNVSNNFSVEKQTDCKVEKTCDTESDSDLKVKQEPVDSGYEKDILPNIETMQNIDTSSMFVKAPNISQTDSNDGDQSTSQTLTGKRKKQLETDTPSSSKFILISNVTSLKESQDMGNQASSSVEEGHYKGASEIETVSTTTTSRFKPTPTQEELDEITEQRTEPTTLKQNNWAVKLLRAWLKENEKNTNFESFDADMLNDTLMKFYGSLQTRKGKDYSKSALIGIRSALCRHLTLPPYNRRINIINDIEFTSANKVIRGMVNILKHSGKNVAKQRKCLSRSDIEQLYESGVFNVNNPTTLQYKVFWDIMLHFGRRGQEALYELKKTSFQKCFDENGQAYYKRNYKDVRNDSSIEDISDPPNERMYSRPGDPRCPFASLEFYINKLHPKCDSFFQQPYIHPKLTVWYDKFPMGKNKLSSMMSRISKDAGLSEHYTNLCIRATVTSCLQHAGIDALSIITMTGLRRLISLGHDKIDSSEKSESSQDVEEDHSKTSTSQLYMYSMDVSD